MNGPRPGPFALLGLICFGAAVSAVPAGFDLSIFKAGIQSLAQFSSAFGANKVNALLPLLSGKANLAMISVQEAAGLLPALLDTAAETTKFVTAVTNEVVRQAVLKIPVLTAAVGQKSRAVATGFSTIAGVVNLKSEKKAIGLNLATQTVGALPLNNVVPVPVPLPLPVPVPLTVGHVEGPWHLEGGHEEGHGHGHGPVAHHHPAVGHGHVEAHHPAVGHGHVEAHHLAALYGLGAPYQSPEHVHGHAHAVSQHPHPNSIGGDGRPGPDFYHGHSGYEPGPAPVAHPPHLQHPYQFLSESELRQNYQKPRKVEPPPPLKSQPKLQPKPQGSQPKKRAPGPSPASTAASHSQSQRPPRPKGTKPNTNTNTESQNPRTATATTSKPSSSSGIRNWG